MMVLFKECGSYGCTKRVLLLPGFFGWKNIPQPFFGGIEKVYFCPSHVKEGCKNSKVKCRDCKKTAYLSDKPVGWDYVNTPAGSLWFCPKHITGQKESIMKGWKDWYYCKRSDHWYRKE
jgi:hypothetical protein